MKWGPIKELVYIAVGKQNLPGDSTKLLLKSFISCDISKCDKGFIPTLRVKTSSLQTNSSFQNHFIFWSRWSIFVIFHINNVFILI